MIASVNGGDLVYLARVRAGLTQAQLGAQVGMAQNAVSRIERGEVDAGFGTVTELVRACGLEPQVTLAARDPSYARDVRRRLALTPLQRLELGVNLSHVAQSTRRAALISEAAGDGSR
jgi:transcriptional regulator with XRE-family HTH domain